MGEEREEREEGGGGGQEEEGGERLEERPNSPRADAFGRPMIALEALQVLIAMVTVDSDSINNRDNGNIIMLEFLKAAPPAFRVNRRPARGRPQVRSYILCVSSNSFRT